MCLINKFKKQTNYVVLYIQSAHILCIDYCMVCCTIQYYVCIIHVHTVLYIHAYVSTVHIHLPPIHHDIMMKKKKKICMQKMSEHRGPEHSMETLGDTRLFNVILPSH
jgi:hypothetical protein